MNSTRAESNRPRPNSAYDAVRACVAVPLWASGYSSVSPECIGQLEGHAPAFGVSIPDEHALK